MKQRETRQEPIVPMVDGQPPAWIVACLDCTFSHDAHGLTAEDAVADIAGRHERSHRLIAKAVDYTDGYEHPGRVLQGIPSRVGAHPLYSH